MDDLVFKQKYKKYKLRVKLWEKDFKKKHGRVPSKYDIHEASQDIRDSYKMYYKLKTSLLEDTLNDALADDGFDILEMSQSTVYGEFGIDDNDDEACTSFNGGPQLPLNIAALVASDNSALNNSKEFSNIQELPHSNALICTMDSKGSPIKNIKEFDVEKELKLNENAWGENVSKLSIKPKMDQVNDKPKSSTKSNLNTKLFKSTSSFTKRNPRKSLLRSNSDAATSLPTNCIFADSFNTQQSQELLPDLETILTQKAKEQQVATLTMPLSSSLLNNETKTQQNIKTQLDQGWLERNVDEKAFKEIGNIPSMESVQSETTKISYGLSNIDVSKLILTKTDSSIIDSMNLEENMNPVLEENVIKNNEIVKSNALDAKTPRKVNSSDSDSVVSGSDNEDNSEKFQQRVKRRRLMTTTATVPRVNEILKPQKQITEQKETFISRTTTDIDVDGTELVVEPFSADECEKDPSYMLEKKTKTARKKIVPKRAQRTKSDASKATKTSAKKTKNPTKSKVVTATKTSRSSLNKITDESAEVAEIRPPSPGDLKCALALDGGNVTSVPRATLAELENVDVLANRYINTLGSISLENKTPSRNTFSMDAKRAAAKKKLEEKIASGKLNENFVRINIEKKRYARGKKSINYSKYKKKLWKDKKRVAALSGPDMDMGGCDGGVFKCFTCGQPGHFAQNCKIKGDTLLPLSAQLKEDPSPFPTLEEVAQMATKSATIVHSRNIKIMPEAKNVALLYENNEKEDNFVNENTKKSHNDNEDEDQDEDEEESCTDACQEKISMDDEDDDDFMDIDVDINTIQKERKVSPVKGFVGHKIPEDFLKKAGLSGENNTNQNKSICTLYDLNEDGSVKGVTPEVMEALHMFGHTNFRKGQDRAVMRILSGLSTLVTLSTGSGKSLCYQLPAFMYSRQKGSITLVVSPLVSLMEDQVTGVPHFLRAHCLHTNQTKPQRLKIMQMIENGEVDILLVSPEAIVSGERSTGFGSILRQLPPIAFACIDEAHCVSQWSHNFRPSYLMICKVLKKNLGVRTILGLTATATLPTRLSIIEHLGITDGEAGIITDTPLPDNLILSVSKDENRDAALLQLLNSERFEKCQSIIVYCTRRDECERISGFLRTCMQDRQKPTELVNVKNKRKRICWQAEPYHAGMPASRRRTVQNAFMKNELRIVVATIAFGMGINKPDIRAIIHYNMPRSFESYVQEIGRAGRDGKIAHCHLFLDAHGNDQNELRRHIYANSIDRHVIRKLLQNVFISCSCAKNIKNNVDDSLTNAKNEEMIVRARVCPGHEIGFSIASTVEALDIPEENIATLLCYMELDPRWNMNVLSSAYMKAKIISYGGAKYLKHAARECPPLAMAIALEIKRNTFKEDSNIIEFPVVDIAAAIGWNSGVVKHQLKNLEWTNVNGYPQRSPLSVQLLELGFRVKAPGDFTAEEIDDALDTLYERAVRQEKTQLIQLQYVFQGLSSVSYNNYVSCSKEDFPHDRSEQLKGIIRDYFVNDYPKDLKLEIETITIPDEHIIDDVHALMNMYPENKFSGRTIARIFHGIASPNFPAIMWGRCKFWRAHTKSDFNRIIQLANGIIVKRCT